MSNEENKAIIQELKEIARAHNIQFRAILNIEGGRGWINYSKIDENDYNVQISTSGNFEEYKAIRKGIEAVFAKRNAILANEVDYKKRAIGFQKELLFMEKQKYDKHQAEQKARIQAVIHPHIGTQIIGDINQLGGSFNSGSADTINNSSINSSTEDEKWFQKEIVKMILSFFGGVAATIVGQLIWKYLF